MTCQGDDKPIIKAIWTLDTCAPIVGSDVLSFKDERELLRSWGKFLRSTDPDLLIGYNIVNFDFPYLINRAATLGVEDFPYWGRMIGSKLRMKDTTFSSKAYGTRDSKEITIEGRVQFDLLQAVQRDHKLSSYSLNAVSAHFLGEQKEDVHHSAISELQAGTAETRRRLAVYCLKDAYLPQRLLDKLMYMYNYIEMARATGVPLSFLLSRGQSIKVMSQILRKAAARGMLVPHMPKKGGGEQSEGGVAYEGATVLDATRGVLRAPHRHFDFASLYPSIMMAHNLCYCTLVPANAASRMAPEDISKSPTGDVFVKANKTKESCRRFWRNSFSAQARKGGFEKAQDPLEKAVLDGRQLALKVSANSVYGFTGATVGQLPCLEISSSTTSYGTWLPSDSTLRQRDLSPKSVERVFLEKFRTLPRSHPDIIHISSGVYPETRILSAAPPPLPAWVGVVPSARPPISLSWNPGSDAARELWLIPNGRRTSGGGGGSFRWSIRTFSGAPPDDFWTISWGSTNSICVRRTSTLAARSPPRS